MLIELLCGNRGNREDFDHYLYDYTPHLGGRLRLDVSFEMEKEGFHALEDNNHSAVTWAKIPNRLRCGHKIVSTKV